MSNRNAGNRGIPSPILSLFISRPRIQILCTFIDSPTDEFTITVLGELNGFDNDTVADHITDLLAFGVIEEVPSDDPTQITYRFDAETDLAKVLLQLDETVFETVMECTDTDGRTSTRTYS
ncbi:hypothetical protein [Haloarchaeobius sp. DFWS5]|uniref:hypothetical protein n=1 Tax=Haloarchaeobius sp. DFWS5 TaxID=3446114 RepID=UPI003EBF201D